MEGHIMQVDGGQRLVIECPKCGLIQFDRENKTRCNKCQRQVFRRADAPPPEPEPVIVVSAAPDGEQWRERLKWNVKKLRRIAGLSQRALADRMKVQRTYVSKIETGGCVPKIENLGRLAANLNTTVATLLEDMRAPRHQHDIFMEEITQYAGRLDESSRAILVEAAKKMRDGQYTFQNWIAV